MLLFYYAWLLTRYGGTQLESHPRMVEVQGSQVQGHPGSHGEALSKKKLDFPSEIWSSGSMVYKCVSLVIIIQPGQGHHSMPWAQENDSKRV